METCQWKEAGISNLQIKRDSEEDIHFGGNFITKLAYDHFGLCVVWKVALSLFFFFF